MPRRSLIHTLRRASTPRLIAGALGLAIAVTGTAVALAGGGGPVPPAKPTAVAIHDAFTAPDVPGVQADITFTNHLVDAASLQGGDPLLSGAHGRLWMSNSGMLRLELQSDRGDAQITSDGKTVTIYDPARKTVYRAKLPAQTGRDKADKTPPTLADIEAKLADAAKQATIGSADPTNVAGEPAYTVKVSPRHDGGLLGRAELAWDAAHGVPLRAAIYAAGHSAPVLELKATNITFDAVPASTFAVAPPGDAKVTDLNPSEAKAHGESGKAEAKPVTGVAAVTKAVSFPLAAPASLAGLPRHEVRLIDQGGTHGALVLYGRGLGGIAVLEQPADAAKPGSAPGAAKSDGAPSLPSVSINGATGQELDTALGSLVRFTRGRVTYTVVGSVPPAAAEAAARGL